MAGIRMMVVWCPDWPVVSWGVPLDEPAAVLVGNRVVASTPAARASGVAKGQRRRDAQSRCPELAVLERDADREARLFEPVAAALDAITPRVEVAGAGLVGFPTRGPSRFFGGDGALASTTLELVEPVLPRRVPVRIGVADGVFAARLAARKAAHESAARQAAHESAARKAAHESAARKAAHESAARKAAHESAARQAASPIRIVEPGETPTFLADLPITTLEMPELTDVLVRLGLTTLGSLAGLSAADVVGRFGSDGRLAHRLAQGEDDHPPDLRHPAPDLAVTWLFEPPVTTVDRCAYAAKALADELHDDLLSRGLSCTRVAIEVETEAGREQMRLWRHKGALSAAALADRARWQLESWLERTGGVKGGVGGDPAVDSVSGSGPDSGIARLTLVPDEVVAAGGRQLGLWGARNDRADDVTRVVARLQAMLGPDAVTVPEYRGGVGPGERLRMVPAAVVDLAEERPGADRRFVDQPWPGMIPAPSPPKVNPDPLPVQVLDDSGRAVGVSGRGELGHQPRRLMVESGGHGRVITRWTGPWPAEQRWWNPLTSQRRARLQVVLDDGSAHLLLLEQGMWHIEATYD